MAYKPYSIRCPQFEITSGGIRVLYGLHGWLLAKGQISFLNAVFENKDFIGIYSDIHHGNELGANTVVRYLLNRPGVMCSNGIPGPTSFLPSDKLYYFSRLFGDTDDEHYLFLPILNMHLFKDLKKKRTKKAVFYGKAGDMHFDHPDGCIPIDRRVASDQAALAELLNECQVMYCYDPVTAMTEIARLCGCRVVMFNDVYTKAEFSRYEPGMNGISWGKEEEVKLDTQAFRDHYKAMVELFSSKLDQFIEETQK